jgi:hypothetical protein
MYQVEHGRLLSDMTVGEVMLWTASVIAGAWWGRRRNALPMCLALTMLGGPMGLAVLGFVGQKRD